MRNVETHCTHDQPADPSPSESRRTFLKITSATALAAPLILTSRRSAAQVVPVLPPSPPTTPWLEELPITIEPLPQTDLFASPLPPPQGEANTAATECGRAKHQRWDEFFGNPVLQYDQADLYELKARANPDHVFHPDYPSQLAWSFEGLTSTDAPYYNPTIVAHYGRPVIVRLHNYLPPNHGEESTLLTGFGTPEISMHLHNLHTPSESDGFPGDYFSETKYGPTLSKKGKFKDHFYPNVYAGLDEFGGIGDMREALGTLWYHDHTMDFTAPNSQRGLAGFYLLYDELDSGDEHDSNPNALRLPSYPYDYPLKFQDKRFDSNGIHIFDSLNPEGTLGDKITVNGKIEPVLKVARRKYRLRLLNAGSSRFYEFYLVNGANVVQRFTYIANDGNLLHTPLLNQSRVRLGVAERADIVVDFSRYPLGTQLYLVNRLQQTDTRGPKKIQSPGTRVLKLIVHHEPTEADVSQVPTILRPIRMPTPEEILAARVRNWTFARKSGLWTINDRLFNAKSARATISKGSMEIWNLNNPSGGWSHPIHIHFEEGIILNKFVDGIEVPVPLHERGRKDVYVLGPNTRMRVFLRFRDFVGKYVMHCHNTIHEDHAMMLRWDIRD